MKKLITVVLCITLILSAGGQAFAAAKVTESPDVKIIIDGKIGTYSDVPIIVSGRTLLPLRALLVNLGVRNDDQHIIWNGLENSVTINKDTTKIYLRIDSTKAYVNDVEVTLDAAPMLYKNKTYIPAKFVAQSLGKTVVWDGSVRAVLIRDKAEYEKVKAILDKSDAAMDDVNKCKVKMILEVGSKQKSFSMNMNFDISMDIDKVKKLIFMNMKMNFLGMNVDTDSYYANYVNYTKNPLDETWEKKTMTKYEFDKMFEQNSNTDILNNNETIAAGLNIVDSADINEIKLQGDVFLGELMNKTGRSLDTSDTVYDRFNVGITLNKNTYLINKIDMDADFHSTEDEIMKNANMKLSCTYSDYNGNFEVVVPKEAIESAVEEDISSDDFDF